MARQSDCIYCARETGSTEHMFLAALGGVDSVPQTLGARRLPQLDVPPEVGQFSG